MWSFLDSYCSKSKRLKIIEEHVKTNSSANHGSEMGRRRSSRIANNKPYRRETITTSSSEEEVRIYKKVLEKKHN